MKPITVLHIIDSLALGGTELQVVRTLRRLDANGFRQVLCLLRWMEYSTLQALEDKIETHTLNLAVKNDYRRGVIRLRHLIDRIQPDVLHTHLFKATIIGRIAGRLTHRPVITTLANTPYEPLWSVDDPGLTRWKVKAVRTIDAATAAWTTWYVANSEAVKQSAIRHLGISGGRITVVHRGIGWETLPTVSAEQARAIRAELGWTDAAPLLLNVGRLVPQKGLQHLMDAMAIVIKALPHARLAIAGEGRLRASLEAQIQANGLRGIVRLLGERRDVPPLLAATDLFIFPSLSEGFPNALLEAMAYGKPCIASRIEAVEEIAGSDGAVLIPPRSPLATAEAILMLARDPDQRRRLSAAAALRARHFDLQESVHKLEAVYREVVAGRGVAGAIADARAR
ncbi:MAG: glycosyltransferase [bacterium]